MSEPLTGQTITVTTGRNLNTKEMADLIQTVFGRTGCPTCTSGGNFVLRQELELPVDPALKVRVNIT
jgi:hypothetical protein